MSDYHFRHFTLTVSGRRRPRVRLYNWLQMRPVHVSPVIMAVLRPLVEAQGDVVPLETLISSARGARRPENGGAAPGRRAGSGSRHGRAVAAVYAIRAAASRLRKTLGAKSVRAVKRQGYCMGWAVREGVR